MRDMHSNISVAYGFCEVVTSGGGAVSLSDVDLQGVESAEVIVAFGANGGDTLNATNKFTVTLSHADDDGTGSADSYATIETDDVIGVTPATGVCVTVDAAAEDEAVYNIGYIGGKRFLKVTVTPNGTLTSGNPVSVAVVKGGLSLVPAS